MVVARRFWTLRAATCPHQISYLRALGRNVSIYYVASLSSAADDVGLGPLFPPGSRLTWPSLGVCLPKESGMT